MKIIRSTRWIFSIIGFLSDEPIFSFKCGHTIASILYIFILILCKVGSITYVVRHLNTGDNINCFYAAAQAAAVLPSICSFVTMMYHKDKIHNVIFHFQNISDKCKRINRAVQNVC